MKTAELDLKQWMRKTLENQIQHNQRIGTQLQDNTSKLEAQIAQLDTDTELLVANLKAELNDNEYTALRKAMKEAGINDQFYLAVCTSIHSYCRLGVDLEHVVKLPKRHLILNTSPNYFHFYFFPYKYRLERHLIESEDLTAWFAWLLSMLINEFKM